MKTEFICTRCAEQAEKAATLKAAYDKVDALENPAIYRLSIHNLLDALADFFEGSND